MTSYDRSLKRLIKANLEWWKSHRPEGMTVDEHMGKEYRYIGLPISMAGKEMAVIDALIAFLKQCEKESK